MEPTWGGAGYFFPGALIKRWRMAGVVSGGPGGDDGREEKKAEDPGEAGSGWGAPFVGHERAPVSGLRGYCKERRGADGLCPIAP
jgi:hypothetical protein